MISQSMRVKPIGLTNPITTNDGHPFRFSITENGTWGGGSTYSTGVTTHGTYWCERYTRK